MPCHRWRADWMILNLSLEHALFVSNGIGHYIENWLEKKRHYQFCNGDYAGKLISNSTRISFQHWVNRCARHTTRLAVEWFVFLLGSICSVRDTPICDRFSISFNRNITTAIGLISPKGSRWKLMSGVQNFRWKPNQWIRDALNLAQRNWARGGGCSSVFNLNTYFTNNNEMNNPLKSHRKIPYEQNSTEQMRIQIRNNKKMKWHSRHATSMKRNFDKKWNGNSDKAFVQWNTKIHQVSLMLYIYLFVCVSIVISSQLRLLFCFF